MRYRVFYPTTGMWRSHMPGFIAGFIAGERFKKYHALLPSLAEACRLVHAVRFPPPQANRSHHRKHAGVTGKFFCRSRGASAANASLRQQLLLVPRGAQNLRGPRRELCARSLIYETHVKHEIPVYCLPAHPPIYGLSKAELHSGHYTIPQWTLWFLLPPRQGACAPNMSNDKSYSFHSCCRQTPYSTCILLKGYVSWIATWAASRRRRSVHWMRWVSRWRRSIVEELFGELKTRYIDPGPT